MNKRKLSVIAFCLTAALCTGCAGKEIGDNSALDISTTTTTTTTTAAATVPATVTVTETSPTETTTTTTASETTTTTSETTTTTTTTTAATTTTTTTAKQTTTTTTTQAPKKTTTTTTTTTTTAKQEPVTPPDSYKIDPGTPDTKYDSFYKNNSLYTANGFTQQEIDLIKNITFVGDSVCSGLKAYGWMPKDQVLAEACAAARNIFTLHTDTNWQFVFHYGNFAGEFKTAYTMASPKLVVCSMGMNDINLVTTEQYCNAYLKLLDWMKTVTPDAKLFVTSITPTRNNSFPTSKINKYNAALKQALESSGKGYGYIDITTAMKGADGNLASTFPSGDGIHVGSNAYAVILKQICAQLL